MDASEAPERLPPQNLEAEQCVLGSMLLDAQCIGDVLLILAAEDFYLPANAEIFSVMAELFDANQPVDLVRARYVVEFGESHDLHSIHSPFLSDKRC